MAGKSFFAKVCLLSFVVFWVGQNGCADADQWNSVRGSERAELFLKAHLQELKNAPDQKEGLIGALKSSGLLTIPSAVRLQDNGANLPASADMKLRREIGFLASADSLQTMKLWMSWLPTAKKGAVYDVEGSGDCFDWIMFRVADNVAHAIATPEIFQRGVCSRDGINGYFASLDGEVIAMTVENTSARRSAMWSVKIGLQVGDGFAWDRPLAFLL